MASLPFKQRSLSASRLLREFSCDVLSDELVWHRDREGRTVRALEGRGWALQLDGGLPQPIRLGEAHHIPAGTWHRLLRRPDATTLRLVVELKKGDRVQHGGREATVKVPDARGDLVGIDPDGPDDLEMVPEDELEPLREKDGADKPVKGKEPHSKGSCEKVEEAVGVEQDEELEQARRKFIGKKFLVGKDKDVATINQVRRDDRSNRLMAWYQYERVQLHTGWIWVDELEGKLQEAKKKKHKSPSEKVRKPVAPSRPHKGPKDYDCKREKKIPLDEVDDKKKHPRQYAAPEGSKRDKELDASTADLKSGDPDREKRAWRRRDRMEKEEREKKGWKNKPRPDTKTEALDPLTETELREMIQDILGEELSKKLKATLRKKAEERGFTPGSVETEYKKGLAAWGTSGSRPGISQHAWAMARVNAATPSKDWASVKKS